MKISIGKNLAFLITGIAIFVSSSWLIYIFARYGDDALLYSFGISAAVWLLFPSVCSLFGYKLFNDDKRAWRKYAHGVVKYKAAHYAKGYYSSVIVVMFSAPIIMFFGPMLGLYLAGSSLINILFKEDGGLEDD